MRAVEKRVTGPPNRKDSMTSESATPPGGTHAKKKPKSGIPTDISVLVYSIQIIHSSWKVATA